MTVYVDDARIPARVGRLHTCWSHLTADDRDELHAFAARLGLRRAWFQDKPNQDGTPGPHWHYDVTDTKRAAAIAAGATPLNLREMGQLITARRAAENTGPRRVQLRRTTGWRLPANTVVVARPTRWGNPFTLCAGVTGQPGHAGATNRAQAVALFAEHAAALSAQWRREVRRQLGGRHLACWCPPDQPCHADVLLAIANTADEDGEHPCAS
jgi:hypothetical protein